MKIIIILFSSLLLFSCNAKLLPVKANEQRIKLNSDNISKLNGSYEIVSKNSIDNLDYILTFKSHFEPPLHPNSKDKVVLKALDNRHLQVLIMSDSLVLESKKLKGELKDDYFEFHSIKIDLLVIINISHSKATRIGLLNDGNLTIEHSRKSLIYFVILPVTGVGIGTSTNIFKRKPEK